MAMKPPARQEECEGFLRLLKRHWRTWLVVACVAAAARAVYLAQYASTPFFDHLLMDARGYHAWAVEIASGQWLGGRVFYQEPLYPYLLALIGSVFGMRPAVFFVAQMLLGIVNCVLVATLGRRVAGDRWSGLIAGLICALYGPMLFYEAMILKPVWGVFFLLVMIHFLISAWERPRWWLWMLAGLSAALLGLTRGNALLAIPFVLGWIAIACRGRPRRRLVVALGSFLLATILPLAGVMLRNYVVGREFVLSSSHAGFNFYIGNNPDADGTYRSVAGVREDPRFEGGDARALASRAADRALGASEASSFWFSQGFEFMRRNPAAWARLQIVKFARFFNAWEAPDTWSPGFMAERVGALKLAFVGYGMLAPVALLGLVALHRRGARAWLLEMLIAATVLGVVIFYVFGRYRMPVVPLFAVLAGGGVTSFVAWLRRGEYARPAAGIAGVGLAIFLVNFVTIPTDTTPEAYRAGELVNLGNLHLDAGEIDKAKSCCEQALILLPDFDRGLLSLATLYLKEGERTTAFSLVRKLLAAHPNDAQAHYVLAKIHYEEERPLDAIEALKKSTRESPGFFDAWSNLGALYMEQAAAMAESDRPRAMEFYGKARAALQKAAALDTESAAVWKNLATACYNTGDIEGARLAWKQGLRTSTDPRERARMRDHLDALPPEEKR